MQSVSVDGVDTVIELNGVAREFPVASGRRSLFRVMKDAVSGAHPAPRTALDGVTLRVGRDAPVNCDPFCFHAGDTKRAVHIKQ